MALKCLEFLLFVPFFKAVSARTCSATLTLVICNVAAMICLVQGVFLFNDALFQGPLAFAGMGMNLLGGMWYTLSQVQDGKAEGERKEEADDGKT